MTSTAEAGPAGVTIPETIVVSVRSTDIGVTYRAVFHTRLYGATVDIIEEHDGLPERELSGASWTSAGFELDEWSAKKVPPRVAAMLAETARVEFERLDGLLVEHYMATCRACIAAPFTSYRYGAPTEDARRDAMAALAEYRKVFRPAPEPKPEAQAEEGVALATEGPAAKPEPEPHNHFGEVFAPGTCPACAAIAAGDTSGEVAPT